MAKDFSNEFGADLDDVKLYLEEIKRIPLLDAQKFHTLLLRAADGDENAQIELVNANLRLVVNIAQKFIGQGAAFPDLIQEGNIGLVNAVKKFSTKSSATFIEYAEECIETAIVSGLHEMNSSAQISLDIPVDEHIYHDNNFEMAGEYVEGLTLRDFVEDNDTPTHFERVNYLQMKERLREVLETLTPHEKKVLSLRFGFEDGKIHSNDEISKILKLNVTSIPVVEAKALKKLRQVSNSNQLRDFY